MAQSIRHADAWRPVKRVWIKHEGAWKLVKKGFIKNSDIWVKFYSPEVNLNITASQANFNLRSAALATGDWDGVTPVDVIATLKTGVILSAASGFAFSTGSFPAGSTLKLTIEANAYIAGKGGNGGNGSPGSSSSFEPVAGSGTNGIDAMSVTYPISINNLGHIWGGGGGGGGGCGDYGSFIFTAPNGNTSTKTTSISGGGGGGGRGAPNSTGGSGNQYGGEGTLSAPGAGGAGGTHSINSNISSTAGGAGGQPGQAGQPGVSGGQFNHPGAGGAPGRAVVGITNVTWILEGDVLGAKV